MTDWSIVIENMRSQNPSHTIAVDYQASETSSNELDSDETSTGDDNSASDYTIDDSENTEDEGNTDQGNHQTDFDEHHEPGQYHNNSGNHSGTTNATSDALNLTVGLDHLRKLDGVWFSKSTYCIELTSIC
jgi:hypothetical protein